MAGKFASRRRRLGRTFVFGLGLTMASVSSRAAETACPVPAESVRVAAVVDDLDLALEDGRTLRLAGLQAPRPTPSHPDLAETARVALADRLSGRDILIAVLSPTPDRWERLPALAAMPRTDAAGPGPLSINAMLIEDGSARVRPDAAIRPCLTEWLTLESSARSARLGLWSDPYYAVVRADDRKALAERTGTMALVEGWATLRQTRGRLELDLGPDRYGFAATVSGSEVKRLLHAGINLQNLVGSTLRIRGFLDDRFGPRIELTDAGQIELLEMASPHRGPSPTGVGKARTSDAEAPVAPVE